MQYSKMKLSVGLFVSILFSVLAYLLYMILDDKGTFDKRYSYKFSTKSASFLSVGMPLKLSGFDIGTIDKIALKDNGKVSVIFSVNKQNRKWITYGTTLTTIKPLIGSTHIVVNSVIHANVLDEDSILRMLQSDDINDMITKLEPVVEKVIKIIDNIQNITAYIASDDSDLSLTLRNLRIFSESLSSKDSDFALLIKNFKIFASNIAKEESVLTSLTGDKSSTKSLISGLNDVSDMMQNLKVTSQNLNKTTTSLDDTAIKPLAEALKKMDTIMVDIQNKLDTLDGTVNAVGSYENDLVGLKEQISVSVEKSNQIMDKIDGLMQDDENQEVLLP